MPNTELTQLPKAFLIIYLIALIICAMFALAHFLLEGVAMKKLAGKTGIEKGWLSFVPLGHLYLRGKFAEKDGEIYGGKEKKIKWSSLLPIGTALVWLLFLGIFAAIFAFSIMTRFFEADALPLLEGVMDILKFAMFLLLIPLKWALFALQCIVNYKTLHLICKDHAPIVLILSILITPLVFTGAIFVYAFSKKYPTYLHAEARASKESDVQSTAVATEEDN